ncbi:MAG: hypothetical protein JWP12_2294 [Bacteroidetes bacterium]|nr:hypothetical protein [Bacteroidota bacterium]
MKKNLLLAAVLVASLSFAQAQKDPNSSGSNGLPSHRTCATQIPDPAFEQWMATKIAEHDADVNAGRSSEVVSYTIPVIIHIINAGTAVGSGANITLAQAQSEIAILNADYAGTNTDITSVPSAFTGVKAGNTGVQFCLAKVSPTGTVLAEVGVERISYVARGWTDPNTFADATSLQNYFDGTIKPATIWDPTKYLNVWVAQVDGSGLLGYASFPAGTGLTGLSGVETATTSGVVINEKAWGNIGTAATGAYNKGRTATHEIGHWLGLRHIWGDGTCATDYCNDTPPAQTSNYGCPTHPYNVGVCTGNTTGEMFMNYMDYVDDACMYMFSANQATRIQTTMANGTYRIGLNTSGKCNTPYTLDASISAIINPAAASSSCATTVTPLVTLTNSGSSTLTSVTIKYSYDGGTVSNYAWTGSLASGSSANITLPTSPTLTVAAHTITVATNLPNGSADLNTANDSKTNSFTVTAPPTTVALPFTEGFQGTTFVPANWTLNNPDADLTWTRVTTAGGFGTSTASARMDNYTPTTSTVGMLDELLTPKYNFSTASTATMKFDVAYARYNNTSSGTILWDSLIVMASSNCGTTWTRVYAKGSTALATAPDNGTSLFVPTATQWRTETVSLNSFIGQSNVGIKIQCKSGWGQAMYLDNINIASTTGSTVASVAIAETTGTNPMCAGASATFTATPTNGGTAPTYQWQINGVNVGGATAATFTTATLTNGQIVTCIMTSNLSGVTGSPATSNAITMTVNAIPATPTVTTNSPVCAGSTINLTTTAVTGATYAWTGPSTFTSAVQNPTRPTSTAAMAGTYSLTVTTNGCTSAAGTATVVVNALPATPTVTTNSPVCAGSTINLSTTAVTGATYAWTGPATFTSTVQNPTRPTATVAMAGTYSLTITKTGCTSVAGTATVVVNALPATPTVTTNSPVCAGSTINLTTTAVTGATYAWTGPSTFTSAVQNPTRPTSTAAMAGTYSLTVTTNGCTSAAGTATVVVNAIPATPTVTTNSPVCAGSTINLSTTAVTGATYAWTGPATFTSAVQSPTRPTATAAMGGTYSVTVTTNGCTSAAGTATVTIKATPATPTATATSPVCTGQTISLSTPAVTGATYAWSGPPAYTSATRNPNRTNATVAMAGTYSITVTTAGCTSAAGTATVVVNTTPATPTATSSSPACIGSAVNFTAPTVSGASYSWTGPSTFTSTSQNPVIASAAAGMGGTYSVTVTANGCTSATGTTALVVNASPTALATTTTASGCSTPSGSITIGATTSGTAPFTYSVNGSGFATTTSYTGLASGTYTVTVKDANGCTFTTSAVIGSSSGPTALSTTPASSTCGNANGSINIGAVTGGVGPYTYSFNTGAFASTTSYTGLTAGTYTVVVKDAGGCTFTVNPVVTDIAGPSAQAATTVNSTCGNANGAINIGATTGGTAAYAYAVDGSGFTATTTYAGFAAGTYPVIVQDANGCQFTTSATVANTAGPTALAATAVNSTCGNANGTINIGATTGGALSYTYSVDGSGFTGTTAYTGFTAGTYPVIVQDANGCQFTTSATVANTAGPTAQAATTGNSTCEGTDGTIDIGATTGGTAVYMYSVDGSSFSSTTSYSGFAAGTYNVSVQDANGCSFTTTAVVGNTGTIPTTPTVTQSGTTLISSSATGNQWYVDGVAIPGENNQSYTYTANGTYTVEVTNGGCTSAASTGVVVVNTGIAEGSNPNSLSIFPNPNDGNFTVSFSSTEKESYTIEITNALGQVVLKEDVKDFTGKYNKDLSVEEYGKGIYMISLTNANHETVKKMMVY